MCCATPACRNQVMMQFRPSDALQNLLPQHILYKLQLQRALESRRTATVPQGVHNCSMLRGQFSTLVSSAPEQREAALITGKAQLLYLQLCQALHTTCSCSTYIPDCCRSHCMRHTTDSAVQHTCPRAKVCLAMEVHPLRAE